MLPRRFNYTGSTLDAVTRLAMIHGVAHKLGKHPEALPPMNDLQLWRSFKSTDGKHLYGTIPENIRNQLNPGDFFAFELGKWMDTGVFPEGQHFEEIQNIATATAGQNRTEDIPELGSWWLLILVAFLMQGLNHPFTKEFKEFIGI
jgi:hypothetical protein